MILSYVKRTLTFGDEEFVQDLSNISDSNINFFVDELPNYNGKGYFNGIETFIGKLLIGSLKGSKECEMVFNDIGNYPNFIFDGAFREFYNKRRSDLEQGKSR